MDGKTPAEMKNIIHCCDNKWINLLKQSRKNLGEHRKVGL